MNINVKGLSLTNEQFACSLGINELWWQHMQKVRECKFKCQSKNQLSPFILSYREWSLTDSLYSQRLSLVLDLNFL